MDPGHFVRAIPACSCEQSLIKPGKVIGTIPQGSVLGLIPFMLCVNDQPQHFQSHVKLFAHDTKIFNCSDEAKTSAMLQEDLVMLGYISGQLTGN